jgi:hypothetical protein
MRFLPLNNAPMAFGPAVEKVVRDFYSTGRSVHSLDGTMLAPLLNCLRESKIPFTLRFVPDGGYVVERSSNTTATGRIAHVASTQAQGHDEEAPEADREGTGGGTSCNGSHPPASTPPDAQGEAHGGHPEGDARPPHGPDPLGLIEAIQRRILATAGTLDAPSYLRLSPIQLQAVNAYLRKPDHGPVPTFMGLPVERKDSQYDNARRDRGEIGLDIN